MAEYYVQTIDGISTIVIPEIDHKFDSLRREFVEYLKKKGIPKSMIEMALEHARDWATSRLVERVARVLPEEERKRLFEEFYKQALEKVSREWAINTYEKFVRPALEKSKKEIEKVV